jgi:hypothetical protein
MREIGKVAISTSIAIFNSHGENARLQFHFIKQQKNIYPIFEVL